MGWSRRAGFSLTIAVLAAGCSMPGATVSGSGPDSQRSAAGEAVKRITVGVDREPDIRPTALGPARVIAPLLNSGLSIRGDGQVRHPILAEAVPTLDNGLWKLLPDGRMETTWKLREGAQWHDGVPLTMEDLLFSLQVGRDRELPGFNTLAYGYIEEAAALDARTLTISWKEAFVEADALFDVRPFTPLPRHLLEAAYRNDKASFLDLPYWNQDYVGTGPYRVREWVPGIAVTLDANGQYVLGRPRIDEIEVRYIPDANTLTANLLAGAVDVTTNVGSIDLGIQLRDQWREGTVAFNLLGSGSWVAMFPQFINPRPAVIGDVGFRRALTHAIDRQEIVDTLIGGMSPVAHSFLSPGQPQYREIEASIARYEFDPRRAAELLQELGYTRGADGRYRDSAGQGLEVEILSGPQDQVAKPAAAIAGHWERLGVAATPVRVSPQRLQDFEYLATFPGFSVWTRLNDVGVGLRNLHSSQTQAPSNNFRVASAGNTSRYMNPEIDGLLGAYYGTIPLLQRTEVLGGIIRHLAEQVTVVGLYYNPLPWAISNRLLNVTSEWPNPLIAWNAHEWDLR